MPLVFARGVAILGRPHFASLRCMAADFLVRAALLLRIVRAFLLVPNWPFRSCKNVWVCGIHEAWHIISISCAGTAVIAYVVQDILAREGFPYERRVIHKWNGTQPLFSGVSLFSRRRARRAMAIQI